MRQLSIKIGKAFLIVLLSISNQVLGTHIRSAEIIVERINCTSLSFKIKVIAYTNTSSQTPVGGNTFEDGSLDFGDGTFVIIPQTATISRPDLGPNIGTAQFETIHTYAQADNYKINYFERDRNAAILNIFNPGDTPFSAYVLITELSILNCDKYPKLSFPPVDKTCPGITFFHNSGAVDADGDSLSYELTIPSKNSTTSVDGYLSPANQQFYSNFNQGNEEKNGQPSFSIDGKTGLITWNAPGRIGEYNIAFKILEWRTNPATGIPELLSTMIRDMQITVEDCINGRPMLIVPEDICIVAGTLIDEQILGFDIDNNRVKIEFSSDAFSVADSPPIINPNVVEYRNSLPHDTVKFQWQTNCTHVREQAYQIVIKITDSPNFGAQLVSFKTWQIKIIAPVLVWKNVSLDLINRRAVLEWEPYTCSNAEFIQIWRKVGPYNYSPGECDSGLPKYLGYELVGEVAPLQTNFIDNNSAVGLVDGAVYCYRLVAVFQLPAGGKSYVTTEECIGPIVTDAPIITHVSVEKTHATEGAIRVSWRSPFNIDKALFPEPYLYKVHRGNGFTSSENIMQVGEVLNDTSFIDLNPNTVDSVYNYRLVVYSKPDGYMEFIPVDTSFAASSIRLTAVGGDSEIQLQWSSVVPWSNVIDSSPYHFVYRGGKDDSNLTFLAKADVTEDGFVWEDKSVNSNVYYCYTVMTRGSYGNPAIDTLRNFSQRVCLYPKNDLPPCIPIVSVDQINCDDFLNSTECQIEFKNNLNWTFNEEPGCRIDIVSYNIYSGSNDNDLQLIQERITIPSYADANLNSYAKCYKVTSIDSQGHESERSEIACNDNCTFYELPNVFTPDALDGCNDTFRAVKNFIGESSACGSESCLHFIKDVKFRVYNRWGKEVFSSQASEGLPLSLDWKGTGSNGEKLEGGIYYYWIEVEFEILEESKKYQTIKGWVHLVR